MKQNHNEVIELLSKLYPKCFFVNPRLRQPLKRNIVYDIEKAREPDLESCDIGAAVDWYESHIGYEYAVVAGANRLDLKGRMVGKITETEEYEATARIALIKKREPNALKTVRALHGTGGMTDDQMRKIPAPLLPTPVPISMEQNLDNIFAAVAKARELLSVAQTNLQILQKLDRWKQ